jgi:hypothetical protein
MLKFVTILKEDQKSNDRFIERLMPKLTEFFEDMYPDTNWTSAAFHIMNEDALTILPNEYRVAAMNANIELEKLGKLTSNLQSTLDMNTNTIVDLEDKLYTANKSIKNKLSKIRHITNLFSSMGKGSFMEIYSVPTGVMIELWEKWRTEIYIPAIEELKMQYGGRRLSSFVEAGIPEAPTLWKPLPFKINFGADKTWKIYKAFRKGTGKPHYYVRNDKMLKDKLVFHSESAQEIVKFVDDVEMESAINEEYLYFENRDTLKNLILHLRDQVSENYTEYDIAAVIEEWLDDQNTFINTDGSEKRTIFRIGKFLKKYLHS